MSDREAGGRLQIVDIIIQMKRFLCHILIGVVQLHSKSEGAVLLNHRSHEKSP